MSYRDIIRGLKLDPLKDDERQQTFIVDIFVLMT